MTPDTERPIVNVDQAAAWNGHEGEVWTEHADRYDRAGQRHWQRLLDAGLVRAGDAVLDVGCGTGHSTRDVARIAAPGSVVGVDLSAVMLDCARERSRAEGLDNVAYVQGDAQVHPFEARAFDLAVSSFGAMFFLDPIEAFTNIGRALVPSGRLALLAWRDLDRNEWLMEFRAALAVGRELPMPPPDAPTPFSLADPERVRRLLGAAGFDAIDFAPIDEPMNLGTDAADAYAFALTMGIVEGLTHELDEGARTVALAQLRDLLQEHETIDGVGIGSSAWLITAQRR